VANIIGLLDLGKSALRTHQSALHVTGQNIANVNTPGYSRQRAILQTNPPLSETPGQLGTGVSAAAFQRIVDPFVAGHIRGEQQALGQWQARRSALERAEMVFDDTRGYALSDAMNQFWNAWQDLSNRPEGTVERVALLSRSEYLAETIHRMAADLSRQQVDLDQQIAGLITSVNEKLEQVHGLNREIGAIEAGPQNANDLRDRRDQILAELSQSIAIDTFEDPQGRVTVFTGNGRPLVDPGGIRQMGTQPGAGGRLDVVWIGADGTAVDITNEIGGGRIRGWLDVRDTFLEDYRQRLDDLAGGLISEVNGRHAGGFDLNADPGEDFFSGTGAMDISVNPVLLSDADRVAAAASPTGVPGDGANAVAIAGLQQAFIMNGGTTTAADFYQALVTDVGTAVQTAGNRAEHHDLVSRSLNSYRESISGVSLDEEMLNLVKFQHAFEAAAKLVTTVDEMFSTVMDMLR
jgi:flagellar hook-associated protein 1 FlgK